MTDQTGRLEARIKELEDKLARMERGGDPLGSVVRGVLPDETRMHMRAAWREQLLAARAFIDHWIERDSSGAGAADRHERIKVE